MKDSERRQRIIKLWLKRPLGERRRQDIVTFFGYLDASHQNLLTAREGDPYDWVKSLLAPYVEREC
jgi:hypothetical protein